MLYIRHTCEGKAMKRTFTDEEKNYIYDAFEREISITALKNHFGCTWYEVAEVLKSAGYSTERKNLWTNEEVEQLKELNETHSVEEIAKALNKSVSAVSLKINRLNLTRPTVWTTDEETFLRNNWGVLQIEVLSNILERSTTAIRNKVSRLGLPQSSEAGSLLKLSDISEVTGISVKQLKSWGEKGLKLKTRYLSKNDKIYYIDAEDLFAFLGENQDIFDSRKIEPYILGPEPAWLKEKRRRDVQENFELKDSGWSGEEVKKATAMRFSGKTHKEISLEIKRSELAISKKMVATHGGYTAPQFWSGKELNALRKAQGQISKKEVMTMLPNRTPKAIEHKCYELGYVFN